ncbi:hypothetical protein LHV56_12455 [Peribacillus frigoritolerans]|uniref:hypothetical protein n=1 Tax=Peribacillus frigoritolerans TaxID=450367 RepID=UPI00207B016F|nr:hypothetical protein [Peribacillus frigoritolerans]USK82631.1 hypothetical protein LHV56_12455 [Peribacillus frigoritolerans]
MPVGQDLALSRIGSKFTNNEGSVVEIINLSDERAKSGNIKFICRFVQSGEVFTAEYTNLTKGHFKDYNLPSVFGVGYTYKGATNSIYYKTWNHMLERCYNENFHAYPRYGGSGVKVCDRWLHLKLFEEDVKKLPNHDLFVAEPSKYSLDKDMVGNKMIYSPETCTFANATDQSRNRRNVRPIYAISKESGQRTRFESVRHCEQVLGIPNQNIDKVLKGKRKSAGGYTYEYIDSPKR